MKLNDGFLNSLHDAMALLRNRGPREATEAIQRALRGEGAIPEHAPAQPPPADTQDLGHFSTHTFANEAGRRDYKLYVPGGNRTEPLPLVVMLHGCTQDADDFAAGTQMNRLADRLGFIVAYPVQPQRANQSKCWNWFKPADQRHGAGEPALIAGITREVMARRRVDPARVFVAGLSAGGAMAAIMIQAYPELYAAAGVHSGLPVGVAHDLPSALAAMRGGKNRRGETTSVPRRALIVFHGDADTTVNPSNAALVMRGFEERDAIRQADAGRREYTVQRMRSADGVEGELWTIHGAPHAWAGGSEKGSYTDASGPDSSAEMVRFFLAHPKG
jgi:poly(hydroxyalkanoate) depolymerase family esterase